MSAKKSYSRYFIILQEDEKGFSVDANKFPTGYSKIENRNNKCKISYYVQNLNKSKEPYYMILICNKKNEKKLIKLGKMNIDDYGRAELSYEYDINNIANSGISMDKIKGAAIVHFQETSMRAALTGFISGIKLEDWKKYSIVENKALSRGDNSQVDEQIDKSNEETKKNYDFEDNRDVVKDKEVKESIEIKKEEIDDDNRNKLENNIFDEYEKNIETSKNINSDTREINDVNRNESVNENIDENESDNITDDVNDVNDVNDTSSESISDESKIVKENNDITESEDYRGEDIRNKDKEKCECKCKDKDKYKEKYEEKYKEKCECKCKDKYKDNKVNKDYPVGELGEFFKNLAKDLEEVTDVCPEVGKCKWYKVPLEKLENINETSDFNKYTVLYYPMICYYPYIKKYGHYLVGYKCDSKDRIRYLVYAIPGTKIMNDQPFGGATGFTTWVCRDYADDKMYSVGYWIMFYDFKNSRIMMPVI